MADDPGQRDKANEPPDTPLVELAQLRLDADPELAGRVRRDINRRTFAADGLDFSLNVMLHTFWDHLRSAIDAWPGSRADGPGGKPKK